MIDGLKPYSKYKDPGVPWLGEVPEHWEMLPGRTLFREINDRGHPNEELLSVTISRGVVRQADLLSDSSKKDSSNEDKSAYKLVEPGDIAYNKMRAWQGAVGVSAYRGIVSPAYIVQRLRNPRNSPQYIHYLLRTPSFTTEAERWSYGITSDQWSLRAEDFKNIYFSVPGPDEQTAIVRFLDWADHRIRRVIRARRRRIKLLEEYKQALINQAVTGKIDVRTGKPYPKYKDSGVPWLGKVPEHWEVRPLKRIARLNPSKSEVSPALRCADAVFLPMEKVGADGRIDTSIVKCVSELWNGFTYFRQNDVIVAKITPCFENGKGACLTNLPTEIGFGSTEFHVLRPSSAILPEFLYLVTILREFRQLGVETMTGAAGQQRVPSTFIEQFPTCLPPLSEQTAIVEFLDEQTAKIDAATSATHREIELLKEFRTRLVADVVTGKLDVREAAAKLPDEPPEEEAEPLDEDEGAAGGEADLEAVSEEVET